MCRIISFASIKGGVGKTSIIYTLSGLLAEHNHKVCVIDGYFNVNQLSLMYLKIGGVDLKEYLSGKTSSREVLNKCLSNLYFVKTNSVTYDYLKHTELIKFFISEIAENFEYILIDVNCFNEKISSLFFDSSNECFVVLDDEVFTIRNTAKLIQKVYLYNNIYNLKLILNKQRIIKTIKKNVLESEDIFSMLKVEGIFVFKKYFKDNIFCSKLKGDSKSNVLSKFYKSVIGNTYYKVDYFKPYRGVVGYFRRLKYERYEV